MKNFLGKRMQQFLMAWYKRVNNRLQEGKRQIVSNLIFWHSKWDEETTVHNLMNFSSINHVLFRHCDVQMIQYKAKRPLGNINEFWNQSLKSISKVIKMTWWSCYIRKFEYCCHFKEDSKINQSLHCIQCIVLMGADRSEGNDYQSICNMAIMALVVFIFKACNMHFGTQNISLRWLYYTGAGVCEMWGFLLVKRTR